MPETKKGRDLSAIEARRLERKKRRRRRFVRTWAMRAVYLAVISAVAYGIHFGRNAYRDYKARKLNEAYCTEEKNALDKAKEYEYEDAIDGLDKFAEKHPDFEDMKKLRDRISELVAQAAEYNLFKNAMKTESASTERISDCESYLKKYRKGRYRDEIAAALAGLFKTRDDEFYTDLLQRSRRARKLENSLRIMERYLNESPGTRHGMSATKEIERLRAAIDRRDYEDAVERAQNALRELRPMIAKTALKDYIKMYPKSPNAPKAQEFLDLLEDEKIEEEYRAMVNAPPWPPGSANR